MTTPLVAVAVSSRNRADRLQRLLAALDAQTLPREQFEVVVVDDGSTDDTPAVLAAAPVTTIRHATSQGPAAGRNAAWRASCAPLVAFTDDDVEPEPGWLAALLAAADAHPGAIVQGRVDPHPEEVHRLSVFTRTLRVHAAGPWYPTANIAYPRELLERLGGFDETHRIAGGEDTDLAWRALEQGTAAVWAPEAHAYHAVHHLGPKRQLQMALAWSDVIQVFKRHPGVRRHVYRHVFWKRSHALLLLALGALLVARRLPPLALFAVPYARFLLARTKEVGAPPHLAAWLAVYDAVEVFATVRGAVRYRVFVL